MTFAQLKAAIAQRLRRTDAATAAVIASELANIHQEEIQQTPGHDWKCQEKRTASGALPYTVADAADGIALPTDFMRARDLWFDQAGLLVPVTFLDADEIREREAKITRGEDARPLPSVFWTIRNNRLVLWPAYSGAQTDQLRLDYYARLPFYATEGAEDWFSINATNALIFGTCWMVCLNHWDDARAGSFAQMYQMFVQKAVAADTRNAGGPRRAWTPAREFYGRS